MYIYWVKPLEIILSIILSIGAIQGIIYGITLWRNQGPNKIANKFLAVILWFFAYRLLVEVFGLFGIGTYDAWYHILLEYNWAYGALIFFFVKASVTPNFKLNLRKDWVHFLPVVIEFAWSNFIKSQNFYWDGTRESLTWLGYWGYVVWMHYPTMYIVCAALIIFYSKKAEVLIANANATGITEGKSKTKWLRWFLLILRYFSILIIVIVLTDLIFFDYAFNRTYNYPLFIVLAIITYGLGLVGFSKRNESIIKHKVELSKQEQKQLKDIASNLNALMHAEKFYKNPDLSLAKLSKHLNIKPYLLTKCLNHHFEKKFSDYINELRIEELKQLLRNPENSKFTLLSLAFEAGFNSKASFNRAVKKVTGKSPSALKSTL